MYGSPMILDCTLRDGGYYTRWDFSQHLVETYIDTIQTLPPVGILEIGYRSLMKSEYFGEYYYLPKTTLKRLHAKLNDKVSLAIMLNAKECRPANVHSLIEGCEEYVKLVRFALAPDKIGLGIELAQKVKQAGYEVSLNIMYMHRLIDELKLFDTLTNELAGEPIDYIYLVDSYGSCLPEQIYNIFQQAKQRLPQKLGFHGHDNICMAFANTLAAIEAGADIIDSTILGMGRGAGNLRTELITAYMDKTKGELSIDFSAISDLIEQFDVLRKHCQWGNSIPYIISGFAKMPQKNIMDWIGKKRYSTSAIVRMLNGNCFERGRQLSYPKMIDGKEAVGISSSQTVIIIGGGETAIVHSDAIAEYAKAQQALIIHSSLKNVESYANTGAAQIACLAGQEAVKALYSKKNVGDIATFVVSSTPRIEPKPPENWKNRIMAVDPLVPHPASIEVDGDSPLGLAFGIARDLKATNVILAGFDGYPNDSEKARLLGKEVQILIDQFGKQYPEVAIQSITPTVYKIPQTSVYALLSQN